MSSIVFSCHVQHATPQIINPFSPHLEFITHDLRSTRTVIYNFVSANHLMGSLSPMFILPRNSPYTHYSHRVSHVETITAHLRLMLHSRRMSEHFQVVFAEF